MLGLYAEGSVKITGYRQLLSVPSNLTAMLELEGTLGGPYSECFILDPCGVEGRHLQGARPQASSSLHLVYLSTLLTA